MAQEYRDIGSTQMILPGGESVPSDSTPQEVTEGTSQVYKATHNGVGIRLPYRERSFISFSFGGKWIEDFDLIATVNGDRMTKGLSSNFEDLTSDYDVLDGQYYHSTHFSGFNVAFTLSTDGMDQQKMEEFKYWFAGGKTRELILAEHPNRAIMARVAQPPEMEMLPFEKEIQITAGSSVYTTSTTVYKGNINIEFVADEPFWHSIINIFGSVNEQGTYVTQWDGVDFFANNSASQDKLKDVLKIVYEDGIPIYNMISDPMFFGDEIYAEAGGRIIGYIASQYIINGPQDLGAEITEEIYNQKMLEHAEGYYNNGLASDNDPDINFYIGKVDDGEGNLVDVYAQYYCGAVIEDHEDSTSTQGVIDGAYMTTTNGNSHLSITQNTPYSIYYAGTAPTPVKLTFTIPIDITNDGYIMSIANSYVKYGLGDNAVPYNTIKLLGKYEEKELNLTTPNFLTSYNNVVYAFNNLIVGTSWEDIRAIIRDEIRHPLIRKFAIILINMLNTSNTTVQSGDSTILMSRFKQIFGTEGTCTFTIELDSKTGEAIGTFTYNEIVNDPEAPIGQRKSLKENIGDMLSSNYLTIEEKNYFGPGMQIMGWVEGNENTHGYSHKLIHNFPVNLNNFSIKYKNLYY